jgi:co-chaperonin GroES (HSP10)
MSTFGKTRLRPLGPRVILKKIESDTKGGLRMPDSVDSETGSQEYEVVALAAELSAASPRPGDRIYLAKHKGYKIEKNDGEELYAAEVVDILAVEEDGQ